MALLANIPRMRAKTAAGVARGAAAILSKGALADLVQDTGGSPRTVIQLRVAEVRDEVMRATR